MKMGRGVCAHLRSFFLFLRFQRAAVPPYRYKRRDNAPSDNAITPLCHRSLPFFAPIPPKMRNFQEISHVARTIFIFTERKSFRWANGTRSRCQNMIKFENTTGIVARYLIHERSQPIVYQWDHRVFIRVCFMLLNTRLQTNDWQKGKIKRALRQ